MVKDAFFVTLSGNLSDNLHCVEYVKKTRKSRNTMCKVDFNHQPVYLFG